jgi:hypothetical protein
MGDGATSVLQAREAHARLGGVRAREDVTSYPLQLLEWVPQPRSKVITRPLHAAQNPSATWGALRLLWGKAPELTSYGATVRAKTALIPGVIDRLSASLDEIVETLPDYYVEQIRPAAPFLFREWMPIGYAGLLAIDDPEALQRATLALMSYGAAVTLLDDVADTDAFDRILGIGSSDVIAAAALAHVFPDARRPMQGISSATQRVIDLVRRRTDHFLKFLESLDNYSELEPQFRALLRSFFEGVVFCRKIRDSMMLGKAHVADVAELAASIPHGMTVALVGLVSFAYNRVNSVVHPGVFLRDAQLAQVTCHYQNALATLARELRDNDPCNPIVLDAIQQGIVDQRDYVGGHLAQDDLRRVLAVPRARIQAQLVDMMTQIDARREHYERLGVNRFFDSFGFGVRNLNLLYRLAWGRV